MHLQTLAPTNPHWARVGGYGLFSLCVIHKEGLRPSRGDINMLMMMTMVLRQQSTLGVKLLVATYSISHLL
jgi:hypothetical protein